MSVFFSLPMATALLTALSATLWAAFVAPRIEISVRSEPLQGQDDQGTW